MSRFNNSNAKSCYLCNGNHFAKFCKLNSQQPQITTNIEPKLNYETSNHNHLTYKKTYNYKTSNNAAFIMTEFFKIYTANHTKILIEIEELAYSNYNSWIGLLSKDNCLKEMNKLNKLVNEDINKFIANNGISIIAKFIVSNS